jgi:hypothetical protein
MTGRCFLRPSSGSESVADRGVVHLAQLNLGLFRAPLDSAEMSSSTCCGGFPAGEVPVLLDPPKDPVALTRP